VRINRLVRRRRT